MTSERAASRTQKAQLTIDKLRPIGLQVAFALAAPRLWVHRRVESVTFIDDVFYRRRVSVDFSTALLPSSPVDRAAYLVPITLLHKRPMVDFDVADSSGGPLSVLTTGENGALATALLLAAARASVGDGVDIADIEDDLEQIACRPAAEAAVRNSELFARLATLPTSSRLHRLISNPPLRDLTALLASNFILAVVLPVDGPKRRIVKFSYVENVRSADHGDPATRRWDALARSFGLRPQRYSFDVPSADSAESFHFELAVPEGITINEAYLAGSSSEDSSTEDAVRALELPRPGVQRIHIHAPPKRDSSAFVWVSLRIARVGWLRTAMMVTAAVSMFMFLSAWRLPTLIERSTDVELLPVPVTLVTDQPQTPTFDVPPPDRVPVEVPGRGSGVTTDVAALLMALVAVLLAVVIRAGEHPITSRSVFAMRLAAVLSALSPMGAAWLLAFGPDPPLLTTFWWVLAGVSVLPTGLAILAYAGPNLVAPDVYDDHGGIQDDGG